MGRTIISIVQNRTKCEKNTPMETTRENILAFIPLPSNKSYHLRGLKLFASSIFVRQKTKLKRRMQEKHASVTRTNVDQSLYLGYFIWILQRLISIQVVFSVCLLSFFLFLDSTRQNVFFSPSPSTQLNFKSYYKNIRKERK